MDRSVRSTEVSVAAVEGMESGRLVPPCNQLRRWIAEEAAYVRCARVRENSRKNFDFCTSGEVDASEAQREDHRLRGAEVRPVGAVVAGPYRAISAAS